MAIPVTEPPTEPLQLKFGFPTFGSAARIPPLPEEYLRVTYPNNEPRHLTTYRVSTINPHPDWFLMT